MNYYTESLASLQPFCGSFWFRPNSSMREAQATSQASPTGLHAYKNNHYAIIIWVIPNLAFSSIHIFILLTCCSAKCPCALTTNKTLTAYPWGEQPGFCYIQPLNIDRIGLSEYT
jgi:hypothetical protein